MGKILYITFVVEISDSEYYTCERKHGKARMEIKMPRAALGGIDAGNLFMCTMQAALADFDASEDDSNE